MKTLLKIMSVLFVFTSYAQDNLTYQTPPKQIKDLAEKQGVTVLISSHDLLHVTDVCERIVVLDKGEIIKDLTTSEATLKELEAHFAQ